MVRWKATTATIRAFFDSRLWAARSCAAEEWAHSHAGASSGCSVMWDFQKASPISKITDFQPAAIAPSSRPDSRTHPGYFQPKDGLMRLSLTSRQPAATTGAPPSHYVMDTPIVGNGRIWFQIIKTSLPSSPIKYKCCRHNFMSSMTLESDFAKNQRQTERPPSVSGNPQNCRLPGQPGHIVFHSLPSSSETHRNPKQVPLFGQILL
jgi:hypothetical protein